MTDNHRQETQARIQALREAISELEAELRRSEAEERAQHAGIERLDDYINAVDTRFSSLQLFWNALKSEWLGRKG